ncbi:MAG: hypothetical protein COU29_02315 [Candidatus Magasanikbacteria bacterium CG10_big_fil_rev_8_21_14_0_10_36_32]|uniref:AAA+ ATPase domain-containing protein n=1 Tax=Candidatus Magasanikbacteria bacterium CG10_big_fil_rev_8_21_14_0_10_36_32 TaxID=1974646 RepID=A0A2M6W715_9BACT|nr:MAG: hypothetical protein COU29_02315 [Candidatus Magasanikbacteria bacterium CG10_big_fil_rev_8_21_14_0_10_36_32]
MIPNKILEKIVTKFKICPDAEKWKAIQDEVQKTGVNLSQLLINKNIIDETSLYQKIGEFLDTEFVALKGKDIRHDIFDLIPNPVAVTHNVVAFDKNNSEIMLAMIDPTDMETTEFIRRKTGLEPKIFITTPADLSDTLHHYRVGLEEELKIIQEKSGGSGGDDLKKVAEELPIVNVVNSILEHAIFEGASDIHIEPVEKELNIRYRIDGILRPVMTLPKNLQNGIVARIKVLSNLKLDEHMIPQDGRFKIQVQEDKVAFRVSIIPVFDGEKIVMRLLPEGAKPLTLEQLGFQPAVQPIIESAIKKPTGMILVTGPTGSGKTTTLYSILGMVNQPGVNISTIEDPIEYHIAGINQSQINPKVGFTFASGLRAFLRQDPNIIMVGEIRDQETAEIAIHAAMTGHLVLSTLHTNDAPTTLPRLTDMGVPPFLVAYTVNIIIAQRLVRKICQNCKKEFNLDKASADELAKVFDIEKILPLFKQYANLSVKEKKFDQITFYKGEGCSQCKQTGFKGRMGIYEVLEMDQELIKKVNEHATANDIKAHARSKGMLTMSEDGLIKAKMGITSISEILRVTKD